LAYLLMPKVLMLGYALGASPGKFAEIESTAVVLLRFVAVYCLFDAMNVVFAGTLKGAGDTRFILLTSLLLTPCPLLASWAGIECGLGLLWCWCVITAWISSLGLIYAARFLTGRWRQMRVIEPELGE
jgi:MATE family multidrug resistance protein